MIKLIRTKYYKRIFLVSIFVISSVYINPALISLKQVQDTSLPNNYNDTEVNYDTTNFPRLSIFGEAPWWDDSFEYRMLINVSNPYSYNIMDYGVSVSFN